MKLPVKESQIQSAIITYLEMRGYKVIRINSGAVRVGERGSYIKLAPAGTPDLLVLPQYAEIRKMHYTNTPTQPFFVECKAPQGKVSTLQISTHNDYALRGVQVITARSHTDLQEVGI
jgi:hypothetical protein